MKWHETMWIVQVATTCAGIDDLFALVCRVTVELCLIPLAYLTRSAHQPAHTLLPSLVVLCSSTVADKCVSVTPEEEKPSTAHSDGDRSTLRLSEIDEEPCVSKTKVQRLT